MEPQADFKELLGLLNSRAVEYVIVGGYAVAFYGSPRFTGDLDILVNPTPENAARVLAALDDFGFKSTGLTAGDFTTPENVIQLGYPPVRVDFITTLTGVSWAQAYAGKTAGSYGEIPVFFLGREQLLANKRALGRKRDLADLEALGEE